MKWTPKKDAELRALAPIGLGALLIASRLGTTEHAVSDHAYKLGVSIVRNPSTYRILDWRDAAAEILTADLRARWAVLIGPMKDDLRADLARIG